jgi:putative redox protein
VAVSFSGKSDGYTRTHITHIPSGVSLHTTAPLDNGGDGLGFSPTDLCAASLAACATTVMGLCARRLGVSFAAQFDLTKEMCATPRRLGVLTVTYQIKTDASAEQYEEIVAAGKACPVRLSLGENVKVVESYVRTVL